MQRRNLLLKAGTVSIALLAGCSSENDNNDNTDNSGSNDETTEENTQTDETTETDSSDGEDTSSVTPVATSRRFGSTLFRPHLPNAETPSSPAGLSLASTVTHGNVAQEVLITGEKTYYHLRDDGEYLSPASSDPAWDTDLTEDNLEPALGPHLHNGTFYFVESQAIRTVDASSGEITDAFRPDNSISDIDNFGQRSTFSDGMLYTTLDTEGDTADSFGVNVYDLEQRETARLTSSFGVTAPDEQAVSAIAPTIDHEKRIYLAVSDTDGALSYNQRLVIGDLETEERISEIVIDDGFYFKIVGSYVLFVIDNQDLILATEIETGQKVLEKKFGFGFDGFGLTTADETRLYRGLTGSTEVVAYDFDAGEETWRDVLVDEPHPGMVVANGVLYVGTAGGSILGYDAETGERLFEHAVEAGSGDIHNLVITDGNLYGMTGQDADDSVFRFKIN